MVSFLPFLKKKTTRIKEAKMQGYEFMYIIKPDVDDEKRAQVKEKVLEILKNNGANVISEEELGKKELLTPFKKCTSGYFYKVVFEGEIKALDELKAAIRINDAVLRELLLKIEKVQGKSKEEKAEVVSENV
jgi:small subunit ribosomal protein S6